MSTLSRGAIRLVLFVLLFALTLTPGIVGGEEQRSTLRHEKYQLPNGLTVILHEDHKLPQVAVNIWYHVGTPEEPIGRSGFAHLFEHLMFMGTKRAPNNQFDILLETGGASNNATTWYDRTNYFDWGPARMLPTMLWLEADRMEQLGVAMTQEKLDSQRDVVRNERREGYDNAPYGPADYLFWKMMFPSDHPYHNPVIGSHEDLIAAQVEDVVAFYDTYYVPNNASLVVAGDFDSAKVRPMIAGLFGSIPRGDEPPRRSATKVGFEKTQRVTLEDDIQFPRITYAWHSPGFYQPGDAEMDILAFALASGKSSRLHKRLVREEQLAVDVSASQTSLRLGSTFMVAAYVKPEADLDRVEQIIDEELTRICAEGPTEVELQRGRAEIETSALSDLESVREVADRLNQYDAYLGHPDRLAWDLGRYGALTRQSVAAAGRTWLPLDRRLVVRVLPRVPAAEGLPTRDVRPDAFAQAAWQPPVPTVFTLPNGLTVWHVDRPGLPLLSAELVLPGGAIAVPRANAGLATLAADMLTEGAGGLDALQFADALGLLGASLVASGGREANSVTLRVLGREADEAFALLGTVLHKPRFEEASFVRRQDLHVQGLKQAIEDAPALGRRVATEWFFPAGDALGVPVDGYPASVEGLSVADVRAFHEQHHGPQGAVLLLAGDLRADAARALVTRHLGAWSQVTPRAATPARPAAPAGGEGLRVLIVDKPEAAQTVIRFAYPGVSFDAESRVGLGVLNTVLGGSFTSRLNANLREDKGWTYGAGSGFPSWRDAGVFVASANVQSDQSGPSIVEFLREFARIRAGDVSEAEAEKARASVVADMVQGFETLSGVTGSFATYAQYGRQPAALAEDLAAAGACGLGHLNQLAAAHVAAGRGVLVLVGDPATIKAQWAATGLPEPLVVSREAALAGTLPR
ncbi:MAG: pitrilysin family protein [Planctomycetota bacterium]|nr:pitrilysin family protein [Planctomycetota bacterium]